MDAAALPVPALASLRLLDARDALEAWDNCRDALDRLFLLTPEFHMAWRRVAADMSDVIRRTHRIRSIRHNGAVYDILDHLGMSLFQHLSNPSITVPLVRQALNYFRVCPEDRAFTSLFAAAYRQYFSPPLASATNAKRAAPGSSASPLLSIRRASGSSSFFVLPISRPRAAPGRRIVDSHLLLLMPGPGRWWC